MKKSDHPRKNPRRGQLSKEADDVRRLLPVDEIVGKDPSRARPARTVREATNEDALVDAILPAVEALVAILRHADSLGVFTDLRDLLACEACGLAEDVLSDGRLVTYRGEPPGTDTGLRFAEQANGRFLCPSCGRLLATDWAGDVER